MPTEGLKKAVISLEMDAKVGTIPLEQVYP